MRRLALVLLALLALPASAQHSPFLWSTKSILEIAAGLTDAGRFGAPGWATASLPTCNAANERAIAYDLTTNTLKFCNGSAWGAVAGGGDALTTNPLSQFAATTSAQFAGVISDETGSGLVVLATTPTLVTPVLGVATATSINKVALTAPATAATLTIAEGKTFTASNTLTLTGTDATSFAFPATSGTVATLNSANTFTAAGQLISPATDAIGLTLRAHVTNTADLLLIQKSNNDDILKITANGSIVSEGTADLNELTLAFADAAADATVTVPATTGTIALTADKLSAFAATSSAELAGVLSDETGSGLVVFATSPTLTTPTLGVATATSVNKVAITAPATSATLTIADGVTLTANNSATLAAYAPTILNTADEAAFKTATNLESGVDVQAYDADLAALAALADAGMVARTGAGTVAARTITGTASEITVTNGDGVAANPTLSLPASIDLGGKSLEIPNSITLPGTCTVGQVYQDSDATAASQFYACTATNTWTAQGAAGAGDVVGPASSTDNAIVRFDGTTGKLVQGGGTTPPTYTDVGDVTIGSQASASTATPRVLSLGGTYGDSVANSYKLKLYDDGTAANDYAWGISSGQMNFKVSSAGGFYWYSTTTERMSLSNTGVLTTKGLVVKSTGAGTPTIFEVPTSATTNTGCLVLGTGAACTVNNTANIGSATVPFSSTTVARSTTGSADVQALNTELITLSIAGTTTASSGNIVPANSIVDAIACRVTTTITTATDWVVKVTGGNNFNLIGAGAGASTSLTAGNTVVWVPNAHADQYNATATTITITTTGTPGAGAIRCAVHSRTFTPPTS